MGSAQNMWYLKSNRKSKTKRLVCLLPCSFWSLCNKGDLSRANNKLINRSIHQCAETFHRKEGTLPKFVSKQCNQFCTRHFIPLRSPHFGDLWEAVAKSGKHFLFRNGSPPRNDSFDNRNWSYIESKTTNTSIS